MMMNARRGANVACGDQVEPGIRDEIWQTIMSCDSYGSVWADGGIMRVRTASYRGQMNGEFAVGFGGVPTEQ